MIRGELTPEYLKDLHVCSFDTCDSCVTWGISSRVSLGSTRIVPLILVTRGELVTAPVYHMYFHVLFD